MKGGIIVDWNAIKAEYIAGGTSYRKLAEKYGVNRNEVADRGKAENWVELRRQTADKVQTKISEAVSDSQAEAVASAVSLINESAMNMLRQIAEETVKGITDEKRFSTFARALTQLKDVLDIKSEADKNEQQARIDNLRRQADADSIDSDVVFVFKGDAERWAK